MPCKSPFETLFREISVSLYEGSRLIAELEKPYWNSVVFRRRTQSDRIYAREESERDADDDDLIAIQMNILHCSCFR